MVAAAQTFQAKPSPRPKRGFELSVDHGEGPVKRGARITILNTKIDASTTDAER
jgi:hypothetical protein